MAKSKMVRKARVQAANTTAKPEFEGTTLCNVLRVPRLDDAGAWMKSARGSFLMDTLAYPITSTVSVKTRSKTDPGAWIVTVDGADFSPTDARALAIGLGCIKDTTTGLQYLTVNADGDDAMTPEVKKVILNRCKRKSTIRRIETICKLIKSVSDTQGVGNVFDDAERAELFNTPASLLNQMRDALYKVTKEKGPAPKFIGLSA